MRSSWGAATQRSPIRLLTEQAIELGDEQAEEVRRREIRLDDQPHERHAPSGLLLVCFAVMVGFLWGFLLGALIF